MFLTRRKDLCTKYYRNVSGGQYSPGYLTELVREIRDATRIREEAMYARLRTLVLDRIDVSDNIIMYYVCICVVLPRH